jgi:hypothetical protein
MDTVRYLDSFVPALDLEGESSLAAQLIALATIARGERPAQNSYSAHTIQTTSRDLTYLLETIPPAPLYLIPRRSLLARAQTLVLVQRHLALCSLPGIGKTALMAALARERPEKAPVFWYTFTEAVTTDEDTLVHRLAIFLQALIRHCWCHLGSNVRQKSSTWQKSSSTLMARLLFATRLVSAPTV